MYFKYNVFDKKSDKAVSLNDAKKIVFETDNTFIGEYLDKACAKASDGDVKCTEIKLSVGIPDEIKEKVSSAPGKPYEYDKEGYVIDAGEVTNVYGETERAVIHAISTIKKLVEEGEFVESFIYDKPYIGMRGIHYFVPGRNDFDHFKSLVDDILVPYKYNFLFFEIGGAMEYKKHPKINEEWEKFATRMRAKSGTADKLQHYTYPWSKNAIHPENGGGSYITQDEMRELIKYCKDRGIDIIPEVPSMSHADYIVRAYPELNERVADKDPDTYCPSNPKTYEVLFDIIDEVLDVFDDCEYFNMGHDELVTIGICDKCKEKDPVELFAYDINKIYNYLAEKGKKVIIACDKFTKLYKDGKTFEEANGEPYIDAKGKLCGGLAGYPEGDERHVPALWPTLDKISKDLIIHDWYWSFNFDDTFSDHDVFFANFNIVNFKNWKYRTQNKIRLKGISCSNWGRPDYQNLQRNCILADLILNAHAGWNEDYDDENLPELFKRMKTELNEYYKKCVLKMSDDKKYITVTHTTNHSIPFRSFYDGDFVTDEKYKLGDYVVTYADGSKHTEKVLYGEAISNENLDMNIVRGAQIEVCAATVPCVIDGKTYYTWVFENPYADKEIKDIKFVSSGIFPDANVYTKEITY